MNQFLPKSPTLYSKVNTTSFQGRLLIVEYLAIVRKAFSFRFHFEELSKFTLVVFCWECFAPVGIDWSLFWGWRLLPSECGFCYLFLQYGVVQIIISSKSSLNFLLPLYSSALTTAILPKLSSISQKSFNFHSTAECYSFLNLKVHLTSYYFQAIIINTYYLVPLGSF